jgi:hypothetical protein
VGAGLGAGAGAGLGTGFGFGGAGRAGRAAGAGFAFATGRARGTTTGAETSWATGAGAAGGAIGRLAGAGFGACGGAVAAGTAWTIDLETVGGVASLGGRTRPTSTSVPGNPTAPASAAIEAAAVTRRIQFPLMLTTPSADDSHVGHRQRGPES